MTEGSPALVVECRVYRQCQPRLAQREAGEAVVVAAHRHILAPDTWSSCAGWAWELWETVALAFEHSHA